MIGNDIAKAARIITEGGLVAFPTETVYGLGANALNPFAVAKIFELKERPSFDPLIVHIASIEQLPALVQQFDERLLQLAEHFWPGPLTFVLPKSKLIPDIVTSGLQTVGIRMPNNKIALDLIQTSNCPIAAPSANKFGQLSPVEAAHVIKQLPTVDYVLEGGQTSVGIESTIVSIEDDCCRIIRPGLITKEDIEGVLPHIPVFLQAKPKQLIAPGLLNSHYSPKKPLYLIESKNKALPPRSGVIAHCKRENFYRDAVRIIYTSQNDTLIEVAAHLFSALHSMEEDESVQQIYIEPVDEVGVGIAIMDRIKKACFQYQSKKN